MAEKLAAQLEVAYVAPQTELEVTLVQLWSEALGVERVGLCDNFFALGGDSVLTRLDARDFENGLSAIRRHAADVGEQSITEPIDLFVFG